MKTLTALAVAGMLIAAAPAYADERADLETACTAMEIPTEPCRCVIDDTMVRFADNARMRQVILLSFGDHNVFNDHVAEGKVTKEEVAALRDYQSEMEPICMKNE